MGSGYVLNFSNRTFADFVEEHTGRNIFDSRYVRDTSGSKANCLRGFWTVESNHHVAKLVSALIDYGEEDGAFSNDGNLPEECRRIAARLSQQSPVR